MAVTADRVIVELEAKVERYNRRVTAAERKFDQSMGRIRRSARLTEQQTTRSFAGIGRGVAAGLAAAGGVVALHRLRRGVEGAVAQLDEIAKQADKLGLTTDALQELRVAAELAGVPIRTFDMAFQRFTRRTAEAAKGTGEAKDALKQLNIELRDANGNLRPTEVLFNDVADAISQVEDPAERVRLAFKLFDSEGVAMVNMLTEGSEAMERMRRRARELGVVMDKDLIRETVRLKDEMTLLERQLSTGMTTALVRLGPLLRDIGRVLIFVAEAAATAREGFRRLFSGEMLRSGEDAIVQRLGRARAELQATQDQIDRLTSGKRPRGGGIIAGAADMMRPNVDPRQDPDAAFAELERLQAKAADAETEVRKLEDALTALRGGATDLVTPVEPPPPGDGGGAGAGAASASTVNAFEQEIATLAERRAALQAVLATQEQLNPVLDDYAVAAEAAAIEARLLAAAEEAGVNASRDQIAALARSTAELEARAAAADQFGARVDSIKAETAAIEAETEALRGVNPALNDYGFAVETALAEQELLNLALAAGIPITNELRDAIRQLAEGYGAAAAEANKLNAEGRAFARGAEDFRSLSRNVFSDFINGAREGRNALDLVADALDRIGAKLLDLSLNAIFNTGGGQQALSGFLGALGGAFGFDRGGPTGGRRGQPAGVVHGEEFVVRAGPAQRYRAILEAINDNERLPGFHRGGFVGSAPNMDIPTIGRTTAQSSNGGEQNINLGGLHVHGVTDADSFRRSEPQMMADLQRKLSNVARRGTA